MVIDQVKAEDISEKPSLKNSNNWYKVEPQISNIGNGFMFRKLGFRR